MWPAAKIIGTTRHKNLQVSMLAGDVLRISSRVIELVVQSRIYVCRCMRTPNEVLCVPIVSHVSTSGNYDYNYPQ